MYGASEQCIDTLQQQCGANSAGECAGDQNSNYVYRIVISQGWLISLSNYFLHLKSVLFIIVKCNLKEKFGLEG